MKLIKTTLSSPDLLVFIVKTHTNSRTLATVIKNTDTCRDAVVYSLPSHNPSLTEITSA